MFLLSLPIILEINQILKFWLINVPTYAPIFTILILVIILITSISGPLKIAVQATVKISVYQAVIGTLLFLTLPISYVFLKLDYPPEVTLYVTIFIEIVALIFRFFFLTKLIKFPVFRFIKDVIVRNIMIVVFSTSLPLFLRNKMDDNFWRLIIIVSIALIWNAIVIYIVGLNKTEKKIIQIGMQRISQKIN